MPKKKNFLGGMQNYNPNTGEYESALTGPNGESPSGFKSFKKQPSEFDKTNSKRMGKKSKVEDWRISEALDDASWSVTPNTLVGKYAQDIADKLEIDKEDVLKVMSKEAGRELKEDENLAKILFPEEESEEQPKPSLNIPTKKVTPKQLDKETKQMFKNREEGLKYIEETEWESEEDKKNAQKRLDRVYPFTQKEKEDLIKDMNVSFNFEGLEQYKHNPHAIVVSHPKHYKAVILGARNEQHAKELFAEQILKSKRK